MQNFSDLFSACISDSIPLDDNIYEHLYKCGRGDHIDERGRNTESSKFKELAFYSESYI